MFVDTVRLSEQKNLSLHRPVPASTFEDAPIAADNDPIHPSPPVFFPFPVLCKGEGHPLQGERIIYAFVSLDFTTFDSKIKTKGSVVIFS